MIIGDVELKTVGDKCYAALKFGCNADIPNAVNIFIESIRAAGCPARRGNYEFTLWAINEKGFLDPGLISTSWDVLPDKIR